MATWLSEKKQVIQTLSQQNEYRNTKSLLLSQEATGFASIYFAGTDGSMQDGDGSDYQGYDAKSQSWYQLAQGTNTPKTQNKPTTAQPSKPPAVFSKLKIDPKNREQRMQLIQQLNELIKNKSKK